MPSAYIPIAIFVVIATGFALFTLVVSGLISSRRYNKVKLEPYECGVPASSYAFDHRFSVRYFLIAVLFIIFDVETVFLYPWAVNFKALGWFGYVEMLVFAITQLLPADAAVADLDFGVGVKVARLVSHTAGEIVAEVSVAADAVPGAAPAGSGASPQVSHLPRQP